MTVIMLSGWSFQLKKSHQKKSQFNINKFKFIFNSHPLYSQWNAFLKSSFLERVIRNSLLALIASWYGNSSTFHSWILIIPFVNSLWWTGLEPGSCALIMHLGDDEVPLPYGTSRKQGYSTHLIYFARIISSSLLHSTSS